MKILGLIIIINCVATITAINIQTNDNQQFEIPLELAQQIPSINNLLEDIGEQAGVESIPLPTITGPIFLDIIELLKIKNEEDEKGITIDWQSKLNNPDVNRLIQLINGCEHLGIESLELRLFNNLLGHTLSSEDWNAISYPAVQRFWLQGSAYNFIMSYTSLLVPVSSIALDYRLREYVSEGVETIIWSDWKVLLTLDGAKLISWIPDVTIITIWDMKYPATILVELEHAGLQEVIMSPDGTKLISAASGDGTIKVWDLSDLNKKAFNLSHKGLEAITISPDSKRLISSSEHAIYIWSLDNLQQAPEKITIKEFMTDPQISPDSANLITLVYNDESSSEAESSEEEMQEESESTNFIKIWDMNNLSRAPNNLQTNGAWEFIISPDSSKLMTWGNGTINVWNLFDLTKKPQEIVYGPHNGPMAQKIMFSPDSKKIIVLAQSVIVTEGNMRIEEESILQVLNVNKISSEFVKKTLSDNVVDAIVSPDSKQLVTWGTNIQIWDINNLKNPSYESSNEYVEKAIITPNSKLISVSAESLKIQNIKQLDQIPLKLTNDNKYAAGIITTPYMNQIVAWFAENNGLIKIWDFSLLRELEKLSGAQIGLITWLYKNQGNRGVQLSSDQEDAYLLLPLKLQKLLGDLFPILKRPMAMEQVEELPMVGEPAPETTGETTKQKKSWWSQFLSRLRLGGPN